MIRGGGVLMHIASLPGPFGIGVFGEEAIEFARKLKASGMKYWQVLPFSYPGMGDSPYQSFSAFAGNWLLIDPRRLMRRGLISSSDVVSQEYWENKWRIDYDYIRTKRDQLLRVAYSNITDPIRAEIDNFLKNNNWADQVALYQAIKTKNGEKAWWRWEDIREINCDKQILEETRNTDEYKYRLFVQYLFDSEWQEVKREINNLGISIIGDMPIYVSADSSDVWSFKELFKLWEKDKLSDTEDMREEARVFSSVAGVPPDYFSADGQLWGNPIYDWEKHKKTKFKWWIDRIGENFKLYDIVRIDHFRAFSSYWEIPSNALTAREGKWVEGPGIALFEEIYKCFPDSKNRLIAEDLGEKTPDLDEFMSMVGLPGMAVMHFSFNPNDNSLYLPHNYKENLVAYTGTHDNNTTLGWLWEASPIERDECLKYCRFYGEEWGDGGPHSRSIGAIIKTLWMSHANTVIVPVQDLLGYGSDTRMNTPGTPTNNWRVRFTKEDLASIPDEYYKELNRLYRR